DRRTGRAGQRRRPAVPAALPAALRLVRPGDARAARRAPHADGALVGEPAGLLPAGHEDDRVAHIGGCAPRRDSSHARRRGRPQPDGRGGEHAGREAAKARLPARHGAAAPGRRPALAPPGPTAEPRRNLRFCLRLPGERVCERTRRREAAMKLGAAAIRAVVGPLFIGHGTQKLFGWYGGHGIEGTGGYFESLGLKPGKRHAAAAGLAETIGGLMVTLGILTPVG